MSTRKPYNLRQPLAVWSALLAIYSVFSTIRTLPLLFEIIRSKGFVGSICSNNYLYQQPVILFWVYIFTLSKFIELGDTAFIVARNQKLIFLHWFHHAYTLVFAALLCGLDMPAYIVYMAIMNTTVHSIMYTFYALKALQFRVPSVVNIFITAIQILQMIIGCIIMSTVIINKYLLGNSCDTKLSYDLFALSIYGSYLILFVNFFLKSYIKKTK